VQEALGGFVGTPAVKFTFDEPKVAVAGPAAEAAPAIPVQSFSPAPDKSHTTYKSHESYSPGDKVEPTTDKLPLQLEKEPETDALQPSLALPIDPLPQKSTPRPEPLITNRLGLRIVGCVANLYIIAESPEGMVLIDQHAAHERVLFEQMLKRMSLQDPASQQLLFPVTLEFLPREADFLLAQLEPLQQAGVGITRFGTSTFLVDALPAMVKPRDVAEFIRTVIVDLQQEGGETRKGRRLSEEVVAKTVCRHAVKANDALKPAEWDHLLFDLLACDLPYTCPHGRPTMIQLSLAELEKKFGRAQ
jgi:DNA mismatch repair protein MutL